MKRPVIFSPLIPALLCGLFNAGCYHMYPPGPAYSGYPGMAPTYQQAPIQTLTPGQPYVPNGTTIPQGTTPTYQNPGGGLQPIPESSDAPTYNSAPDSNPQTPDPYFNNSTYQSPNETTGPSAVQTAGLQEPAPLNPPAEGMRQIPAQAAPAGAPSASSPWPVQQASNLPPSQPAQQVAPIMAQPTTASAPAQEEFARPLVSSPESKPAAPPADPFNGSATLEEETADQAAPLWNLETKKVATTASPFGHSDDYTILRGVVSQEPQDGTWSIVYDDNPDGSDQWAGHLSLAPSPQLSSLDDGDLVEVSGQVDTVVQDRLGKPVYVISRLSKQAPR